MVTTNWLANRSSRYIQSLSDIEHPISDLLNMVYFNVNDPRDKTGLNVNHKMQIICQLVVSFIFLQILE